MELDKIIPLFFLSILCNLLLIKFNKSFFIKKTNDSEFNKPQAFHKIPAIRTGGLILIFFLLLFFISLNKVSHVSKYFFSIIILSFFFFIVGFFEDIKVKINPLLRLFFLFISSFFVLYFFDIQIPSTQIQFINKIIYSSKFFSILFVCLCLMFIVNGCNFIDGFNGLLLIHSIIILIILSFINYSNIYNIHTQSVIFFFLAIKISLFFFNFPKAKIFLGDSGAYIIGVFLSISAIEISNLNPKISPFFFANIFFYIFFEVIFSFFRKFIVEKKSPLKPDGKHLHMLIFKVIRKKLRNSLKANFLSSLIINLVYLILILPSLFYYAEEFFCKTYFFFQLFFYCLCYFYFQENLRKIK
jgi:UDP-N-acetylmuramyl pentapeptide phosphotransferase/UDP-N-acetylglucosamine-1-phosphate transferase